MRPARRAAALAAACAAVLAAIPCAAQSDAPPCAHVDQGYEDPSLVQSSAGSASSAAECQAMCQSAAQCQLFTWYANGNACWLYPAGMTLETLPGAVGGPKTCETQTTTTTATAASPAPAPSLFIAPTAPPMSAAACLLWYGDGCSKIQSRELCLSSRDGRPFKELNGRLTSGQPCVWCGGGQCGVKRESGLEDMTVCEPYDWVKDAFEGPTDFTVAECEFGKLLPQQVIDTPEANPRVSFSKFGRACRGATVTDAGREDNNYYWKWTASTLRQCMSFCTQKEMCTGIEYNAANSYCEVWWRDIGWSEDSTQFHDYECYRASAPPRWDHPELSCLGLTTAPGGCSSITSQGECLSSRDGRSTLKWNGLKVRGEPCVWCGGEACTDRNGNVCETRDYLLHGQGRVYRSFLAQSRYTVANCTSLSDAPETLAPNGRYITSGQGVFWLSPFGKTKHLVQPGLNCSACSCRENIETITSSYVDAIPEGEGFSCSMMPSAAPLQGAQPALGVLGVQRAALASTSDSVLTAASGTAAGERRGEGPRQERGGLPWWSWMCVLMVLCCVAGVCAVVGLHKPARKRKRKALSASAPDASSDEELSSLISERSESAQQLRQQRPLRLPPPRPQLQQPLSPLQPQPQRLLPPPHPGPSMAIQHGLAMHGAHPQAAWPPPLHAGPMHAEGSLGVGMPAGAYGHRGMFDAMDWSHVGAGGGAQDLLGPAPPGGSVRPIQMVGGVDPRRGAAAFT